MDDIPDQELAPDGEKLVQLDRLELRDGKDDDSLPYLSATLVLPDQPSAPNIRHFIAHIEFAPNGDWKPRGKKGDDTARAAIVAKAKIVSFLKAFKLPTNIQFSEGDNKTCDEAKGATALANVGHRTNNEGVEENIIKRFL
jgi:hypothetical protein